MVGFLWTLYYTHKHRKMQFVIPAFGEFDVDVFAVCSCTCEQNQVKHICNHIQTRTHTCTNGKENFEEDPVVPESSSIY